MIRAQPSRQRVRPQKYRKHVVRDEEIQRPRASVRLQLILPSRQNHPEIPRHVPDGHPTPSRRHHRHLARERVRITAEFNNRRERVRRHRERRPKRAQVGVPRDAVVRFHAVEPFDADDASRQHQRREQDAGVTRERDVKVREEWARHRVVIGAGEETRGPPGERLDARFEGFEHGVRARERGRDALGERDDDGGHVARARVRMRVRSMAGNIFSSSKKSNDERPSRTRRRDRGKRRMRRGEC